MEKYLVNHVPYILKDDNNKYDLPSIILVNIASCVDNGKSYVCMEPIHRIKFITSITALNSFYTTEGGSKKLEILTATIKEKSNETL